MLAFENLSGNTPMIRIHYRYAGKTRSLYAKLESFNPSGSIKDRVAAYILNQAWQCGQLYPGQPIVEVSSGNTGIAFAALGAMSGHPVHIFMPDHVSLERRRLLEMYAAQLHLVSGEENSFTHALGLARKVGAQLGAFMPAQFESAATPLAHYHTTAAELLAQLPNVAGFAAGVGTGGTLMGAARRLRMRGAVIAAVEPDACPVLQGGKNRAAHKIEGIGDGFVPHIVDRSLIDRFYTVKDDDAVYMAFLLARKLGLGVGISSGANFLGAVMLAESLGGPVATVFADDNKKYLSTALYNPAGPQEGFISSQIELLGWEKQGIFRR